MSRSMLKQWDNRESRYKWNGKSRMYMGWTRRVTWYQATDGVGQFSIRLKFEDEEGVQHWFYSNNDDAQKDWDAFKKEELATKNLIERRTTNQKGTSNDPAREAEEGKES